MTDEAFKAWYTRRGKMMSFEETWNAGVEYGRASRDAEVASYARQLDEAGNTIHELRMKHFDPWSHPDVCKQIFELRNSGQEQYERAEKAEARVAALIALLHEFVDLCAIGDIDETTEAHGWGDLINRAKEEIK